jgi:tRNA(fMet)-specific endonuclease VapC
VVAVIYLLDTDSLVFMIRALKPVRHGKHKKRAQALFERCRECESAGDEVALSAISLSELELGARYSYDYEAEMAAVRKIVMPFKRYDYDSVSCPLHYGRICHELESKGTPIGVEDFFIAAHALALDATLVSNNTSHFSRVTGLRTANWLTATRGGPSSDDGR